MNRIVLGVDPGSRVTGYGLVGETGDRLQYLESGHISLPSHLPHSRRLSRIYERLQELIHRYQPEALAVEEVFLARNVQSALKLGQVRGIVLLAAAQVEISVYEYSPLSLKKAVVGYGQASKSQVQLMIQQLLGQTVANHNASDALALSICHLFHSRQQHFLQASTPV